MNAVICITVPNSFAPGGWVAYPAANIGIVSMTCKGDSRLYGGVEAVRKFQILQKKRKPGEQQDKHPSLLFGLGKL